MLARKVARPRHLQERIRMVWRILPPHVSSILASTSSDYRPEEKGACGSIHGPSRPHPWLILPAVSNACFQIPINQFSSFMKIRSEIRRKNIIFLKQQLYMYHPLAWKNTMILDPWTIPQATSCVYSFCHAHFGSKMCMNIASWACVVWFIKRNLKNLLKEKLKKSTSGLGMHALFHSSM